MKPGNTKEGRYHCTIDLLFDWFGISCMTDNFCFYLQNRLIQTSQTGGQLYSDTSPLWYSLMKQIDTRFGGFEPVAFFCSGLQLPRSEQRVWKKHFRFRAHLQSGNELIQLFCAVFYALVKQTRGRRDSQHRDTKLNNTQNNDNNQNTIRHKSALILTTLCTMTLIKMTFNRKTLSITSLSRMT
jgi:hypothetical protein